MKIISDVNEYLPEILQEIIYEIKKKLFSEKEMFHEIVNTQVLSVTQGC